MARLRVVMLAAVLLVSYCFGFIVGAGSVDVKADDTTIIGADICCPQGSIPGCYCFPNAAVPEPCPPGYGAIPGTGMCGVIIGGNTG